MSFHPSPFQTRRAFIGRVSQGVGAVALASLLGKTSPSLHAAARGVARGPVARLVAAGGRGIESRRGFPGGAKLRN